MSKLLETIIAAAQDKKAENIVSLDLTGIDGVVTDAFVICTGNSTTQVAAIADGIEEEVLKQLKEKPRRIEGMNNALWVVIDYVDVMVHIFDPETREFYKLEGLWADAPAVKHDYEM